MQNFLAPKQYDRCFSKKMEKNKMSIKMSVNAKIKKREDSSTSLTTPLKQKQKEKNQAKDLEPDDFSSELETPQKQNYRKKSGLETVFEAEKLNLDCVKDESKTINKTLINKRVERAYAIVKKMTGALGGNGYNGAIYGELTMHSMQKITDMMISNCNFTHHSRFIDVGAGLGKPNFHVAQYPGVRLSIGVELEEIRWQVSYSNLLTKFL